MRGLSQQGQRKQQREHLAMTAHLESILPFGASSRTRSAHVRRPRDTPGAGRFGPFSPVCRGEGQGEGPSARTRYLRDRPLNPALSPEYEGEGDNCSPQVPRAIYAPFSFQWPPSRDYAPGLTAYTFTLAA
jgi:hypothetical protein